MSNRPLVSVIMPTFNAESFIEDSIRSVTNQSYLNLELIVIDDCSTDGTAEILNRLSLMDSRIKVLTNKTNLGPLVSRNIGMRISKGDYVAFLDHDDLWRSDKLELQITFMIQNNWHFTYTNYRKFRSDPKNLGALIQSPQVYNLSKLLTDTGIALSSVIYNKAKIGLVLFEDVRPYTEFSLYLRLISIVNNGYLIPYDLLSYRLSDIAMSRNKLKMAKLVWLNYSKLGFGYIITTYFFINYMIRGILRYLK